MTGPDLSPALGTFIERAARPPEKPYYMLLFTPPTLRDGVGAALAFRHEVTASSATSPEVAGTRLAWWGEEVARVARSQPRHPLTRQLSSASGLAPQRLAGLLAEIVGAAQAQYLEPLPEDIAALEHRLAHDWGALCRLQASLLTSAAGGDADETWVEGWGNAVGLGFALLEGRSTAAHLHRAGQRLSEAVAALPPSSRAEQRPLLVLASLVAHDYLRANPGVGQHGGSGAPCGSDSLRTQDDADAPDVATPAGPPGPASLPTALAILWRAWRAAGSAERGRLPANLRQLAGRVAR